MRVCNDFHVLIYVACEIILMVGHRPRDFDRFTRFQTPPPECRLCFCMCASLWPAGLDGVCSYLVFKSLPDRCRFSINMNIVIVRIEPPHRVPRTRMAISSKTVPTILIKYQSCLQTLPLYTVSFASFRCGIFRIVTVCPLYNKVCAMSLHCFFSSF
jgi:hypothetical protein